jgi:CofH/MqnC-like protein
VLQRLRGAGLDALAEFPLDRVTDPRAALESVVSAGYPQVRLTIDKTLADARTKLFATAAALADAYPVIRSINPLPSVLDSFRPTTGYEDVKTVALARLAAPHIPDVQVDWLRYGPKLAQVALTFGANDLDNVHASDDAPDGRRRAPLEEVRRNIQAAGFEPAERDGRFVLIG